MIPDGHNYSATVSGYSFVYRPMLHHERAELRRISEGCPSPLFADVIHQSLDDHIVQSDWCGGTCGLPDDVLLEVFNIITTPPEHAENLYRCSLLHFGYPHLSRTSCEQCKHWWWNPLTGELARQAGKPLERPKTGLLLCQTPAGCPKGTYDKPITFTPENKQTFQHYQLASAAGPPDDELVRFNWTIIKQAESDAGQRLRQHPKPDAGAMAGSRVGTTVHGGDVPATRGRPGYPGDTSTGIR